MPFKLSMGGSTESYLRDSAHIPQHGGRYKVITNASVLDTVRAELAAAGLIVDRELFSSNGKVTVGNHYMSYGTDPNIGIVFTWVNSYDKSTKFHCSVGLHFKDTDGVMITSDMAFFMRKHTGTADVEMIDNVKKQIGHTDSFYNELLRRKTALESVLIINKNQCGEIMGKAFINDYLKADQLTASKHYYDKIFMKSDDMSLWEVYVGLAYSIQHSHPKFYTRSHIGCFDIVYNEMVHTVISTSVTPQPSFPVNILETDPNQISIFDVIAEEEQLHVDMTNNLLIPGFDYEEPTAGSDFDVDKEETPEVFDFEEEEVPFDTTPVPDAFYEDQEKVESSLPDESDFFNFDSDILDLPEL